MELNRISSHMVALGTGALELGALSPMIFAFRERETVVDAEIVTPEPAKAPTPPEPPKAPEAAAPPPVSPDTSALQDIVVRQALRINELEAEVAALKAKAAKPAKAKPQSKAKPRPAKA